MRWTGYSKIIFINHVRFGTLKEEPPSFVQREGGESPYTYVLGVHEKSKEVKNRCVGKRKLSKKGVSRTLPFKKKG